MAWDRKRLLGYVETIQLILAVTNNSGYGNGVKDISNFSSGDQYVQQSWTVVQF